MPSESAPLRGLNFSRCSISTAGMRKARVFPEPVLAAPRTSFPASNGGIECSWTAVMVSNFISFKALVVGSERSSSEKGLREGPPAGAAGTLESSEAISVSFSVASCRKEKWATQSSRV